MHIHASQISPYAALDALRLAQRNAAKQEAERVRTELLESASELAGEDCVVRLEARSDSQKQPKRRNQRNGQNSQKEREQPDAEEPESHISDWA